MNQDGLRMSGPDGDELSKDPQFGLIDVIEAFTAMRHEFRMQSSEDRKLAEQLAGTSEEIQRLEHRLQQSIEQIQQDQTAARKSDTSSDQPQLRQLCETLAEIDFHLSRTVRVAIGTLESEESSEDQQRWIEQVEQQIDAQLARTSRWRRWLLGAWPRQLKQSLQPPQRPSSSPATTSISALQMLQQRVARLIRETGIERIDVAGQRFDNTLMNAVESVASSDVPKGHVATQLCPAYRWRDTIVRYAEVNVSRG